ncbi:MAG: TraR/DksA C4-type zinc finger protein [Proteobacteria bacterium]|jgi:phage/conjugal plasmid C-4 type zinc finger TraR family protein|nr:TraR/DksA C4-type zinc finger protein [Pseudomonadota bacterium]
MDEIDRACQREQEDRDRAIAAARARTNGASSFICADCGEPIPLARQRAVPGVTRCIDCQSHAEILKRIAAS